LLVRLARFDGLAALYRRDIERRSSRSQQERARLGLSAILRATGDVKAALDVLEPLLSDGAAHRAGWAMAFALGATAGRDALRAEGLLRIGALAVPNLNALLASVASDVYLAAGDEAGARRAAEQACHADSASPRSIGALARATIGQRDRVAAVALERAAGVVLPRAELCRALAATFDVLEDPALALAWTQRGLALRPGDRTQAAALLSRVTAAGDPVRIGDSLAWLLSQPEPLGDLVPLVNRALCRLAEVDPPRGAALARRALDVFGPRVRELCDVVLACADTIGERGLAIAVIERQLASGTPGADRAEMLVDLARRRRHAGDGDGAARSLVRALGEGADAQLVLAELDVALPSRSSDGELALLEGRAEALSALSSADLEGTARAWREFGAALWDLAEDREGAIAAWERGAALDGEWGLERLARDLVAFAGHAEAVSRLDELANRKRNRSDVARALAAAAGVALDGGLVKEALAIAVRALEADSSRADVLGVAERAATDEDIEQLERAYDIVARGALGMYGERAAHYRAARQLERRGLREAALRHALQAFEAVPADGVTFVLMMRLAERTGDSTEAVQIIERVASRSSRPEERAAWLRRAALVAGSGEDGKRQRVDVLLRALDANPHAETLRTLAVALAELVKAMPDERDIAELRFTRALRAMLPRLEGPDGARVATFAAKTVLETFGDARVALTALDRAVLADASIDEFVQLLPHVPALAAQVDEVRATIAKVAELARSPHQNVGAPLVELTEALARAASDTRGLAEVLVAWSLKHADDTELLRRAEKAARATRDAALIDAVLAAVPVERRLEELLERARTHRDNGAPEEALLALEEAQRLGPLPEPWQSEIRSGLLGLYRQAERWNEVEALLRAPLSDDTNDDVRVARARELAEFLAERGRGEEAIRVVDAALEIAPDHLELARDLLAFATQTNDARRQIEALTRLVSLTPEAGVRLPHLRKLAPLLEHEGDDAGALARYREIVALDDTDGDALAALERDAERRSDWEALVELLSRRAALAKSIEETRQVRLHRAQILEAKLGRQEDARIELEALLEATGDGLAVLKRLADLNDRQGAKLRAAPFWLRASVVCRDRVDAGELARRACQAYLDGGDVESARKVFGDMSGHPRTPKLVALHVDIARRSEDPKALSEALEEMALSSMDPPRARATMLVEAARAALAADLLPMALSQAQRASRIARDFAEPQLFARWLEYRQRGPGTPEQATTTVAELRAIRDLLAPRERELQAFLLAEALDVAHGDGEGIRELSRVHADLGSLSLVALGLAERLATGKEPERALPLFDVALEGDLRELRGRGDVALSAAQAATRAGLPARALEYLEVAASVPSTRAAALGAQTELRATLGHTPKPPAGAAASDASPSPLAETSASEPEPPSALRSESGGGGPLVTSTAAQSSGSDAGVPGAPAAHIPIFNADDDARPSSPPPEASTETASMERQAASSPRPARRAITLPSMPAPPAQGSKQPPTGSASMPPPKPKGPPTRWNDDSKLTSAASVAALQPFSPGPATMPPPPVAASEQRREQEDEAGAPGAPDSKPESGETTRTSPRAADAAPGWPTRDDAAVAVEAPAASTDRSSELSLPRVVLTTDAADVTGARRSVPPPKPSTRVVDAGTAAPGASAAPSSSPATPRVDLTPEAFDEPPSAASFASMRASAPPKPRITQPPSSSKVADVFAGREVAPATSAEPARTKISAAPEASPARPSSSPVSSGPQSRRPEEEYVETRVVELPLPPVARASTPASRASTPASHAATGSRAPSPASARANEAALLTALARGSIEAGMELVLQLENRSDRTHDLVSVCRRVAQLLPGDRTVLEKLYEATLADRNVVYARAVEHVLRAFDPRAAPLEPPPLGEQVEQPDRVHSMLFRDTVTPATEALGLVWSGALHMFRRDPSSYGVTGLERVAQSSPTPLARLFGSASRLLGLTRTPLFQRKSTEPVTINVALLHPPALLLSGDVRTETPALGYHLGAMLAATLPEHVLLYGAPEAQVSGVLRALVAAFGPPQTSRGQLAAIATLAEMLWESMPSRAQRRLRELCDDPSRLEYDVALSSARQAVRRAGLFVSGDLTVAVREACADLGVSTWGLDAPGGLAALCSSIPAVADLVRLATSPEYASARWQQVRGGGRHASNQWGTV
jgi:tetratricopeptide (TPR) repeat protein